MSALTALLHSAILHGSALLDSTPAPVSSYPAIKVPQDNITPGIWGFAIFFLVAVATVLLVIDMVRRVRRTRYREEVRDALRAEAAQAAAAASDETA